MDVGYVVDGGGRGWPTAGVYVDVTGIPLGGAAGGGCNEGNCGLATVGVSADVPAEGSSSISTSKKLPDEAGGGGIAGREGICVQNRTMNIERLYMKRLIFSFYIFTSAEIKNKFQPHKPEYKQQTIFQPRPRKLQQKHQNQQHLF